MKRYIWVVEWFENGVWVATMWAGLTKEQARQQRREARMQEDRPMRIRKYVPA